MPQLTVINPPPVTTTQSECPIPNSLTPLSLPHNSPSQNRRLCRQISFSKLRLCRQIFFTTLLPKTQAMSTKILPKNAGYVDKSPFQSSGYVYKFPFQSDPCTKDLSCWVPTTTPNPQTHNKFEHTHTHTPIHQLYQPSMKPNKITKPPQTCQFTTLDSPAIFTLRQQRTQINISPFSSPHFLLKTGRTKN